jgi:hypothetical protein
MSDEFANSNIDDECCCEENEDATVFNNDDLFQNQIVGRDIVQLKNNIIPKGLVPLENIFDNNDVARNPKITANDEDIEDCNIGTQKDPKIIKLSKTLSPEIKQRYISLMKDFPDVFAWSYEDLKVYDTKVIQHVIPIKDDHKPFKKKLRRINPMLFPLIEKEVRKLFDAKIIVSLRFSKWVANLVPVRKKSGEIRLCVDFQNLNRVSLKDNYPLPKMDYILQKVVGSQKISMLDGFSGYNQIMVHPDDQEKTTFTTPWGTFMYAKMPFGLMNAGETFQRAMDIAFADEKDKFIVIYLDDITVFSDSDDQHLKHLRRVFQKCRKFGISLNPKKSNFGMQEGKLLGHIISKEGINIDPNRVEAILNIGTPRSKKEVQSFLGKVNFLRRFIPNLAEIIKYITNMLRKGNEIKWTPEARKSFEDIKVALTKAPVLASLNFAKYFILFSFASEHTIAGVLLQKDEQNFERPIAYYSRTLRDSPLRYDIMEKQAYALVKALKEFRTYILHSHVIAYVPSNSVKDILTQPDPEGRRGKWIVVMLEYDLEIKPTKMIKGQGLAKLMAQSNCDVLGINFIADLSTNSEEETVPQVSQKFLDSPWYADIIYVLRNLQAPPELRKTKAIFLKLKATKFCILDHSLYWKDPGGILLNCLLEEEVKKYIKEFHKGDCGGHHYWKTTAQNTEGRVLLA